MYIFDFNNFDNYQIFAKYVFTHLFHMQHPLCFFSTASFSAVRNPIFVCVCLWFHDVRHFVRNPCSFCSQTGWEYSTWFYQCLDWYSNCSIFIIEREIHAWVVQVAHLLPAFFTDRFLSSMSKSSNSPWLLPQTANHYVLLHDTRVLDALYLHNWHHHIKCWLLRILQRE